MIIGAVYWAFLLVGGAFLLLSAVGVWTSFQDQPPDLGSLGAAIGFAIVGVAIAAYSARALRRRDPGFIGVRAGPAFTNSAGRGCLFAILLVGAGMVLYGPVILIQLPNMVESEQASFGIGAAVIFTLGVLMVTPSILLLWRGRQRGPEATASRLLVGVIASVLTFMVGLAFLLTTFFDPRYDVGIGGQLAIVAVMALAAIATAVLGFALRRSLR